MKDSKIKVQTQIQGEQVRVTGKSRDDLQAVIQLVKGAELDQPFQFNNFRDCETKERSKTQHFLTALLFALIKLISLLLLQSLLRHEVVKPQPFAQRLSKQDCSERMSYTSSPLHR